MSRSSEVEQLIQKLVKLGVDEMEEQIDEEVVKIGSNGDANVEQKKKSSMISLPGSGSVLKLMKKVNPDGETSSIPTLALILFCSEGDNIPHARVLADKLNSLLDLGVKTSLNGQASSGDEKSLPSWSQPYSWREMFGKRPDESLYG